MPEITALQKHACAACGASAEWSPERQALVCSYCGTVLPYEIDTDTGKIREIDLVSTLRELPEALRGWKAERKTVKCRSCRAISVFDPERVGQNCQFCGSPELIDYEELKAPIRPQSLLPFKIGEADVRTTLRRWFGSKWLAPAAFKKRALVDTVRGVYVPYWTFDAGVRCRWTAESGTYYYVNQSVRDSKGRSTTRRVRKTRWRHASGELEHHFDDEPVPGTQGLEKHLLEQIEPFPTRDLLPYDTAYLSGFVVEHYQIVLIDAAQQARRSMEAQLRRLCSQQVPGDTYRSLQIDPSYGDQTFKHMLVPVWVLTYDYRGKSRQVLVNGYTGEVAGRYPFSVWKILGIAALSLLGVAIVILLARGL